MTITRFQLTFAGQTDQVSAETLVPEQPIAVFVFAHGAGAGMHHPFMVSMAEELAQRNIASLRFNFLFMEQKKKRPDFPAVAHKVVEAAVLSARELFPSIPLFVSGKSFGGRMSSQYLAKHHLDFVKGMVFFGFPLHPAGKPSIERADHLKMVQVPMLFLQGTRDDLAHWALIEKVCSELPLSRLCKIEGADHSFKIPRQNSLPILTNAIEDWVHGLI
jgi:uncharacterized protein